MQVEQNLPLQKIQILPCVSFTSAREQKATKEMGLGPFQGVGVDQLSKGKNMKRRLVTLLANANLARQLQYLERKVRLVPDLREVWGYINPFMLYGRHMGFRGNFEKRLAERDPKAVELYE